MLISKFDLYKPEWLELVFDHRNKEYGAYDLRQHYAGNMVRAMGITFLGVAILFGGSVIFKTNPVAVNHQDRGLVVILSNTNLVKPPVVLPKKPVVPVAPAKPLPAVKTTVYVPFVVKPDPQAITPPDLTKLQGAIGPVITNGKDAGNNVLPNVNTDNGTAVQPVIDNSIHTTTGLDAMPEPDGGLNGWAKFLSKNLRFPAEAQDAQVSGRVILSFVIEKDGHLSNIIVERSAGYGFDEEAMRVLKLAKAWKPGMQNGQPVRVKYMIPINFQLADNN
jgi:protein TonB